MPEKLQLILHELVMSPSDEWTPRCEGWVVIRVAEGTGYWRKEGTAGELNVGDGLVLGYDTKTQLRASLLCPMRLQFFTVHPQYLGLLTMEEWSRFQAQFQGSSAYFLCFHSPEAIGREFTRLAEQLQGDGLSARCSLLQFWADTIAGNLPAAEKALINESRLRQRFHQLLAQMPASELSACSAASLAQQLNCSVRHFRRLFREEFSVPFRARQMELRLMQAQQLLIESDTPVSDVARQCGYQHMSFFRSTFKKRFGLAPGEWRQQARKNLQPPDSSGGI